MKPAKCVKKEEVGLFSSYLNIFNKFITYIYSVWEQLKKIYQILKGSY